MTEASLSEYWEIDLFFTADHRSSEDAEKDGLEFTTYRGRPAWKQTVTADSYETGASGTLALYYSEDGKEMDQVEAIRDPDLLAHDARKMGEPEEDEDVDDEDVDIREEGDDWDQSAA